LSVPVPLPIVETYGLPHHQTLADEGKLKNITSVHSPVYVPVEGWYGK